MSTITERSYPRLREVVAYLAERDEPTPKGQVIAHIEATMPPTQDDEMEVVTNGCPKWQNTLLWQTTEPVAAGWITKDRRGTWAITDEGRSALKRYPDPASFKAAVSRIYLSRLREKKAKQHRAWLIRGSSVLGANIVPAWLDRGWVSLPASQLPELSHDISPERLAEIARAGYDHLKHQELKTKVDEILAFVTKLSPGDVVMTTSDQRIFVGDVSGDWTWTASEEGRSNLRRPVQWRNIDTPIDFAELPAPLPAKLASGSSVVDLTAELELVDDLTTVREEGEEAEVAVEITESQPRPRHEHLTDPSDDLADELLVDAAWLKEARDLLDERRQVIFYGPPGTGKTYIARKLAADLVGPEQVKLVQFHPAYTYEDFFEGYRPTAGASSERTIGFELRAGPLRELVNRAKEQKDLGFVLIIDEINRANLAKVFGELYFLLEYRDQAIDLLYSSDEIGFTLPPNLYVIGTMNTADRSIALVDSAMRRRFAFIALDPDTEPTRSLLARWSKKHGLPPVAANLLAELNGRVEDPDFRIGPSYFMTRTEPDAFERPRLERIWNTSILPLLQEHFYGQWESQSSRYELESLLKALPERAPLGSTEPEAAGEAVGGEEGALNVPPPPDAADQ